MKQFLKRNYALVAGVALPLAMIAVFLLAGKATVMSVPDPEYDAVFATNYSPRVWNYIYRLEVDEGKLNIRVRPSKAGKTPAFHRQPIIYVFDHKTLYAGAIDIEFDNVVDGKVKDPKLDALNRKRINPDRVSPDGYTFERISRGRIGLITGIFGRDRNKGNYVLKKGIRNVPVVGRQPINSGHFIGWLAK